MHASIHIPELLVVKKTNPLDQLVQLLDEHKGSTLICCMSDKRADRLKSQLGEQHLSPRLKKKASSRIRVTGPKQMQPKPDSTLKILVHTALLPSAMQYYHLIQNLRPKFAIMLYHTGDLNQHIRRGVNPKSSGLRSMIRYAETDQCRLNMLLSLTDQQTLPDSCCLCDNCRSRAEHEAETKDRTLPAQKLLSCMVQTGQLFGGHYLIDVLRGIKSKKVLQCNHDQLSTFGVGRKRSVNEWWNLIRELEKRQIIRREMPYKNFVLTTNGKRWLKERQKLIIKEQSKSPGSRRKNKGKPLDDYDQQLYDKLRYVRRELAQNEEVPPYVIFNNRTLKHMSARYPQKLESLNKIPGVGWEKLNRYGERFLKTIRHHCRQLRMNGPHYH